MILNSSRKYIKLAKGSLDNIFKTHLISLCIKWLLATYPVCIKLPPVYTLIGFHKTGFDCTYMLASLVLKSKLRPPACREIKASPFFSFLPPILVGIFFSRIRSEMTQARFLTHNLQSGSAETQCNKYHNALVHYRFLLPRFSVITLLQTGHKQRK